MAMTQNDINRPISDDLIKFKMKERSGYICHAPVDTKFDFVLIGEREKSVACSNIARINSFTHVGFLRVKPRDVTSPTRLNDQSVVEYYSYDLLVKASEVKHRQKYW